MHLALAAAAVWLLTKLGVRLPSFPGGSLMRTIGHIALAVAAVAAVLLLAQQVDLIGIMRSIHGG